MGLTSNPTSQLRKLKSHQRAVWENEIINGDGRALDASEVGADGAFPMKSNALGWKLTLAGCCAQNAGPLVRVERMRAPGQLDVLARDEAVHEVPWRWTRRALHPSLEEHARPSARAGTAPRGCLRRRSWEEVVVRRDKLVGSERLLDALTADATTSDTRLCPRCARRTLREG